MHILHVYKSYYPETLGGVEKFIQNLTAATAELGCENRLMTTTKAKKNYSNKSVSHSNLQVNYYPEVFNLASTPFSLNLWRAFQEELKWADVVHYHFPWPFADLLHLYRQGKSKPSVVTYHSDIIRQKYLKYGYSPLMKLFLNNVDVIVPTSNNYLLTSPVLKAYQHKTTIIPIGIEAESYQVKEMSGLSAWKSKLPADFILFVGVLRYYKGLHYLIEAVRNTHINVVIVGDGPLFATLANQIKKYQLSNVILTGYLSEEDKCMIYQLAKLLVVPASHRSEAYCISLVEGLLFGLPLISTEIGTGTSFVNQHNQTGLVVNARDPHALKEAILTLLSDKETYAKMHEAAKVRFHTHFTAKKMAERYLEVYQTLCKK